MMCFRKIPVAKKLKEEWGGDYQDFPSKRFCLTVPKKIHRGTLCFFVSFGYRKMLEIRKRVIHVFRSKTFCLRVPKNFVRNHCMLCT